MSLCMQCFQAFASPGSCVCSSCTIILSHLSRSSSKQREICIYNPNCYRKNPDHLNKYKHTSSISLRREPCKWGGECYDKNPDHLKKYLHPGPCKWGGECYRKNPEHLREYSHSHPRCWHAAACFDMSLSHRAKYKH